MFKYEVYHYLRKLNSLLPSSPHSQMSASDRLSEGTVSSSDHMPSSVDHQPKADSSQRCCEGACRTRTLLWSSAIMCVLWIYLVLLVCSGSGFPAVNDSVWPSYHGQPIVPVVTTGIGACVWGWLGCSLLLLLNNEFPEIRVKQGYIYLYTGPWGDSED